MVIHTLRIAVTTAVALVMFSPASAGSAPAEDQHVYRQSRAVVLGGLTNVGAARIDSALAWMRGRAKPDVVAALILALRYNREAAAEITDVLSTLTGEAEAKTWYDWMLWQEAHAEITPHGSFARLKLEVLMRVDPEFARFIPLAPPRDIRLEEIVWGGVAVDGIPALTNPTLVPVADADYLIPGELVFGIEINGDARAYPLRILDWHEMLNDVVGGVPVSLAYCTLCGSGILFETRVDGFEQPFVFGSSGLLFRSNKLMYDRQTDSLWNQFTGRPVSGALAGSGIELRILPVAVTSWREWRSRNPDTRVLSLGTGFTRDYTPGAPYGHYFDSPDLMFPALARDERLSRKDYVFGIRAFGGAKAWPIEAFRGRRVINDTVGLVDVVLIGDARTRTARAYRRDGREFAATDAADRLSEGGGVWRITESALVGPNDERLPRVAGHVAFWFAWAGYLGESADLHDPGR